MDDLPSDRSEKTSLRRGTAIRLARHRAAEILAKARPEKATSPTLVLGSEDK
jgi:hypothetical protein